MRFSARPPRPPVLLYGLLGVSVSLNLYLVFSWHPAPAEAQVTETPVAVTETVAPILAEVAEQPLDLQMSSMMSAPVADAPSGLRRVDAEVSHSLARTFQASVGEGGDALAAVYSRLFMWDLNLRRDVQRGDRVLAVYQEDDTGLVLPVASYTSASLGETLKAYRFQRPGDAHASYWSESGEEVPLRLVGGPLGDYEQITALLRDRPTHQGMDFKTDIGTPVVAPKAGTVTRVNWNHRANGNCIEVRFADGTLAKFLHLEEVSVRPNQHVGAGHVLGLTGNTGRSTAPHLHYQLNRGSRTIDPLEYHGTGRRQVPENQMRSFQLEVQRLDMLLLDEALSL